MDDQIRVLIVEDNPADAELAEYTLRSAGINFISKVIETEKEYRTALNEFSPDVIISDYDLPLFSGADALSIAKELRPELPFILYTGAMGEDRAIEILTGGATDYVMKNSLARLVPAVERALKEAQEHKKRKAAEAERDLLIKELGSRVQERTAALQESEAKYRGLFENIQEMVTVYEVERDKSGRIIERRLREGNPAFVHTAGADSIEHIRGKTSREIFGEVWSDSHLSAIQEALDTGAVQTLEVKRLESERHYVTTIVPLDANTYLGAGRDITDRKRADELLRASEEKFSKAFRNSPNAITITRVSDGRIIEANESAYELFGYTPEEVLGKTTLELNIWAHTDERQRLVAGLASQGFIKNEEFVLQKKDKTLICVNLSASLITIDNQQCFLSSFVDITDRKRAEEELRETEHNLGAANRQKADILESISDCFYALDKDFRFTYVNKASEEIWGLSRADLIGRKFEDVFAGHIDISLSKFNQVLKEQIPQYYQVYSEVIQRRGQMSVYPSQDGISVYFQDTTQHMKMDEDIKQRTAQLEAVNKELESFSYSVSHDLRAPLRAIDGFSQMLLKDIGDKLDPEPARKLNVIINSTRKMGQLIDDLLQLSRTGRTDLHFDEINMKSGIREVWGELLAGNPDRNMELMVGELPNARGDERLLRQLLSNLLGNAVKFTRGRKKAIIEVGGFKSGDFNTYYIRDNGVGFDMQHDEKIFEIFRRLHSEREFEGTGVGLAIAKKIIDKHGSRIWADSKPDEGATFYFTLPAVINT